MNTPAKLEMANRCLWNDANDISINFAFLVYTCLQIYAVSFPPPFTYQFALHITIISLIIMLLIIIIGIIILQEIMKLRGWVILICFAFVFNILCTV